MLGMGVGVDVRSYQGYGWWVVGCGEDEMSHGMTWKMGRGGRCK